MTMRLAAMIAGLMCTCAALAQDATAPKEGAAKPEKKLDFPPLPMCPVMGDEAVNFNVGVNTDQGAVYFCCEDCRDKYKADPKKYEAKITAQRTALKARPRVQVLCPMSEKPIDTKNFTEHNGQKVYFCCKDCAATFKADPAKYMAALENCYTYQTICPVMKEPIDPRATTVLADGSTVHTCCKPCGRKLAAAPEKYADILKRQGIYIDVDKIRAAAKSDAKPDDAKPAPPKP